MAYYKQLRDLIQALDQKGKLVRVPAPIKIETELIPLVRLQFRGLPEEQRKGFLFENVVSVTGRKFDSSIAVGVLAASREIYAIGMGCEPDRIRERWIKALMTTLKPVHVDSAPCQEEVHTGKELEKLGVEEIPVPVNTPGWSGIIRTTASHVITKDRNTGIGNCGCYQGKFLDRNILALEMAPTHHGALHWKTWQEKNEPMPLAIVVGAPPSVAYASVASLPYGTDELDVAGGIAGEPLELVRCKTIDLHVPAYAEFVIEGEVDVTRKVRAATFGEYTGYMCSGAGERDYLMRVTAITHRKNPVYNVILSQFPPSESSKIVQIGLENVYYKHLHYDCNISGILEVHFPEWGGGRMACIIRMKKQNPSEVWQALTATNGFSASQAKIIICVDEDIDPRDSDAVNWALTFRMQPHRDIHIIRGRSGELDYSAYSPGAPPDEWIYPGGLGASGLMIDATLNWPYPPTSLPKKEYMERALQLWNELGLGELKLKSPWYGYNLGYWSKDDEENAEFIVKGDYRSVGKKLLKR